MSFWLVPKLVTKINVTSDISNGKDTDHTHRPHTTKVQVGDFFQLGQRMLFDTTFSRHKLIVTRLTPRILGPSNDFTLLNGWICLHGVLD